MSLTIRPNVQSIFKASTLVWNNQGSIHSWLLCILFWLWPASLLASLFPGSERDSPISMSGWAAKRMLTGVEVVPGSMEMSHGVSWQVLDPPCTKYKDFRVRAWKESGKRWRRHSSNQEQATVLRENGINKREQLSLGKFFVRKVRKQLLAEKEQVTSSTTLMYGRVACKVVIVWWIPKRGYPKVVNMTSFLNMTRVNVAYYLFPRDCQANGSVVCGHDELSSLAADRMYMDRKSSAWWHELILKTYGFSQDIETINTMHLIL